MVSSTSSECHFVPDTVSKEIKKNENGTNSKSERIQDFFNGKCLFDDKGKSVMIKDRCVKLNINRLGKVVNTVNYVH